MSISLILAFHYYNKIKIDKIDQTQKSMSKEGEKKEKKRNNITIRKKLGLV